MEYGAEIWGWKEKEKMKRKVFEMSIGGRGKNAGVFNTGRIAKG